MPKLIMDEAAQRLAATKVAGRPIFAGPQGALLRPGIVDLVGGDEGDNRWEPGDVRTKQLVMAGDACRDLVLFAGGFATENTRRRTTKALTVPICALMDVLRDLLTTFDEPASRRARQQWPRQDQRIYTTIRRRFRRQRLRGPVRRVRNKIGAHLDIDAFEGGGVAIRADEVLGAMGDTLVLLGLAINHPSHSFAWIRGLGMTADRQQRIVQTMFGYPLAVCWITDLEGQVRDVSDLHLAEDPRREIQQHVFDAAEAYNEMVHASGSTLPKIGTVATAELLEAERAAQ